MKTGSRIGSYLRMAAFPLSIGFTSVLVRGTLNRVMIVEQALPASFVGLCFALPLLVAPVRIWLGYQSDTRPLWGQRRMPYILAGTLVSGVGMVGAVLLVLLLPRDHLLPTVLLGGVVLLAFLLYGLGRQLASNTFEALIADTFHGPQRPRAVTLFKVAMFVGIIGTAVILGILLDPFSPTRLTTITVVVVLLTVLGVVGQGRLAEWCVSGPHLDGHHAYLFHRARLQAWRHERLTFGEVMDMLGISKATLHRWVEQGKLSPLADMGGKQRWFVRGEVERLISKCNQVARKHDK